MNVALSSGHVAPLEKANLQRLLACGGSHSGLCQAVWAHPDLDYETVCSSHRGDALEIATWALDRFCETKEAAALMAVCKECGQPPSARLGISDRWLAFRFDEACSLALADRIEEERNAEHPEFNKSEVVNG